MKQVMYSHADKELLFQNISFRVPDGSKVALIGNNGSGKSTLLRMITGDLQSVSGEIIVSEKPYYIRSTWDNSIRGPWLRHCRWSGK